MCCVGGYRDPFVQQAFREKIALCVIILFMMLTVGFLTFGFQSAVCQKGAGTDAVQYADLATLGYVGVHGAAWSLTSGGGGGVVPHPNVFGQNLNTIYGGIAGADLSAMFPPNPNSTTSACRFLKTVPMFNCSASSPSNPTLWPNASISTRFTPPDPLGPFSGCHWTNQPIDFSQFLSYKGILVMDWAAVSSSSSNLVYSGHVLDVGRLITSEPAMKMFSPDVISLIIANLGKDATLAFAAAGLTTEAICLTEHFKVADVDNVSAGCLISQVIVTISFIVILIVIAARFILAMYFTYVIGWRLGHSEAYQRALEDYKRRRLEFGRVGEARPEGLVTGPVTLGRPKKFNANLTDGDRGGAGDNGDGLGGSSSGWNSNVDMDSDTFSIFAPSVANSDSGSGIGSYGYGGGSISGGGGSGSGGNHDRGASRRSTIFGDSREAARRREYERDLKEPSRSWAANFGFLDLEAHDNEHQQEWQQQLRQQRQPGLLDDPTLMHCLVMVPCYSEGYSSLSATLNSVAHSYYPCTHKVLFVIADGIVKGKENDRSTPEILIDMIDVDARFRSEDPKWGGEPKAYSYVAIADGVNRKNYAKVYAGWYKYDSGVPETNDKRKLRRQQRAMSMSASALTASASSSSSLPTDIAEANDAEAARTRVLNRRREGRVPMLLIVKCGNDDEKGSAKPGNRGKRDSQVILMNFLSKVMFDDRMTELEFDIFFKLFTITGVNPDKYECVLMVDADTRIYPDSVSHMVACLLKDDRIMGLCGETKISNKWESWVTMIQVFEYFISHHLAKAFESVFGGVTCLPGCFSMYRIKTPKGPNGYWVPILANPDIVEEYSENVVDTLHKKNLLLLGEDRFLTTMMLRAFPKRRMVFCPPAICKTVVPDTFKVLLSQRRRWINSTIHNLMELLLVKDLCGTFCISMQFVIFMELVGTVVLPAAISFTFCLLILFFAQIGDTTLPLILLAIILGLPAVLIVLTANRLIYVFWMLVYLLSLPIWNFVLPLYAFWHFDDFSWGETRRVTGEIKGHDHSARDGEFDGTGINMKRWSEWVQVRKQEHELAERARMSTPAASTGRYRFPISRSSTVPNPTSHSMASSMTAASHQSSLPHSPSLSSIGAPPSGIVSAAGAPPAGMMPYGMYPGFRPGPHGQIMMPPSITPHMLMQMPPGSYMGPPPPPPHSSSHPPPASDDVARATFMNGSVRRSMSIPVRLAAPSPVPSDSTSADAFFTKK